MGSDEQFVLGGKAYSPQEISAMILRKMKAVAEDTLGEEVTDVVITVPAYFSDAQRQTTREAGEIAGLNVVRIINEPTAAALAYEVSEEEEEKILVYDLGGGTFDVSIVEVNAGIVEVLASTGDTHLGGDDFDRRLMDYVAEEFQKEHEIDLREDPRSAARLIRAAEAAKIELSTRPFARIQEEFIATTGGEALNLDIEISRERFEELIRDLLDKTMDCVGKALDDAGLKPVDIGKVLLVGGSTRIPLVSALLENRIGKPAKGEINPDECVALGAGIQGAIISGEDIDAVLVDVAPYSLGISILDIRRGRLVPDAFSKIIKRNTAIPCSRSEVYTTVHENQDKVKIKVYQGEARDARNNTFLGEFTVENIPPAPAGEPEIVVTFDYDVDGIVHVSAVERSSGEEKGITITDTRDRMSDEEKRKAGAEIESYFSEAASGGDLPAATAAVVERAEAVVKDMEEDDPETAARIRDLVERIKKCIRMDLDEKAAELEDELVDLLFDLED